MSESPYVVVVDRDPCQHCGAGARWSVVYTPKNAALGTLFGNGEDAAEFADKLNEAYRRGQDVDVRSEIAEHNRRIEDLRVSLIRAINTTLDRAGVELPTSADTPPEIAPGFPLAAMRTRAVQAEAERDEALAQLELWRGSQWGEIARENADLRRRAEKAEQVLAEATTWQREYDAQRQRAEKAEAERDDLKRQLDAGQPRIATRCPACGGSTLFVGHGGHLTCSWLECPNPSVADEIAGLIRAACDEEQPAPQKIARESVLIARAIVAEVKRTEPREDAK